MPLPAGTRLGQYEIVALLGSGGMGEVYRARDTKLERDVAIKVLGDAMASDPNALARFAREAHAVAALNHAHIVTIFSTEEAPSTGSGQAHSTGSGQAHSTGSGQAHSTGSGQAGPGVNVGGAPFQAGDRAKSVRSMRLPAPSAAPCAAACSTS
jgi:hypothetical protein